MNVQRPAGVGVGHPEGAAIEDTLAVERDGDHAGDHLVGDRLAQPLVDEICCLGLRRHREGRRPKEGHEVAPPHVTRESRRRMG